MKGDIDMKALKVVAKIVGILAIIVALLMFIIDDKTAGIILLLLGALNLFLSHKQTASKTPARNKKPANAKPNVEPAAQVTGSKRETIKAAGISNYTDAVLSLGHENEEYSYSKKQIIEENLEDEDIWEYEFRMLPAKFVYEPDNPYDSNAIAITVAGEKIGYVKKEQTAHIRKLIDGGKLQSASCEIVGGKMKRLNSEDGTIEKKELNYGAKITLTYSE